MRLIVTGSRVWPSPGAVWRDLDLILRRAVDRGQTLAVVHGQARHGADRYAHLWCVRTPGVIEEAHPADWDRYRRAAGHIRNEEMVGLGGDGMLALCTPCRKAGPCLGAGRQLLPAGHATHGTYGCMQLARAAGIPVWERWWLAG